MNLFELVTEALLIINLYIMSGKTMAQLIIKFKKCRQRVDKIISPRVHIFHFNTQNLKSFPTLKNEDNGRAPHCNNRAHLGESAHTSVEGVA